VIHAGDSRIYKFSQGILEQLTRDHSLVQLLLDTEQISQEEAEHSQERNVVTQSLGGNVQENIVFAQMFTCGPGDSFLLCSDGLTEPVTSEGIASVMGLSVSPQEKANELVKLALLGGGPDNITVQIIALEPFPKTGVSVTGPGEGRKTLEIPAPKNEVLEKFGTPGKVFLVFLLGFLLGIGVSWAWGRLSTKGPEAIGPTLIHASPENLAPESLDHGEPPMPSGEKAVPGDSDPTKPTALEAPGDPLSDGLGEGKISATMPQKGGLAPTLAQSPPPQGTENLMDKEFPPPSHLPGRDTEQIYLPRHQTGGPLVLPLEAGEPPTEEAKGALNPPPEGNPPSD
jgi:hypothetical protein